MCLKAKASFIASLIHFFSPNFDPFLAFPARRAFANRREPPSMSSVQQDLRVTFERARRLPDLYNDNGTELVGDVSARCTLRLAPHFSRFPCYTPFFLNCFFFFL